MRPSPRTAADEEGRGAPLGEGEARQLRRLVELLPIGAAYAEGERLLVNPAVEAITGYRRDELTTVDAWFRTLFGDEAEAVRQHYEADRAAGFPQPRVVGLRRPDGRRLLLEFRAAQAGGATVWTLHDVTERETALRALMEGEARFRSLVEASAHVVWRVSSDARALEDMRQFAAFTGRSPDELGESPWSWLEIVHPDDRETTRRAFAHALATDTPYAIVHRIRRHDGEWRTMHGRAVPVRNVDGTIREWIGMHTDVTEQAQAERSLQLLADAGSLLGAELDLDDLLERLAHIVRGRLGDACLIELTGSERTPARRIVASLLEGAHRERGLAFLAEVPPLREGTFGKRALDSRETLFVRDLDAEALVAAGHPAEQIAAMRRIGVTALLVVPLVAHGTAHGVMTFVSIEGGSRITDDDRRVAELLAVRVALAVASARHHAAAQAELAERRQVEAALRESRARLEEAQRLGRIGSWSWDAATDRSTLSAEFHRILGLEPGEQEPGVEEYGALVHPEDRETFEELMFGSVARGAPSAAGEYRIVRPDGQVRRIQVRAEWTYGGDGQVAHAFGTVQDVTEQRVLEEQFRQAQKMEAVGRLAGGVAHDFNNLLTVISGAAQFLLADCPPGDSRHDDALEITRAARRAADLTRQLLTFSRRQVVHPRRVDLDALVRGSDRMLRRMLGEHVKLDTELAGDLPPVYADPGELEQVLVNLAVNARDAMPGGGRLVIATSHVTIASDSSLRSEPPPGEYVVLSVSDSGVGMDEATRARLFEPFFTTKEPGKGTGLGLPIVFGIVKQAGGHVLVESEAGEGSTFGVYLPRAPESVTEAVPAASPARATGGSETILLVEDDPGVRRLARRTLENVGYTVLEAGSGAEALALSDAHDGPIHLVLTDVVMPGPSGREVAAALEQRRPGVRTLYMSGYAADELLHHRVTTSEVPFIEKPFTVAAMVRAVRRALDGEP